MKFYLMEKLPVYNLMVLQTAMIPMIDKNISSKFGMFPVSGILNIFKNGNLLVYYDKQRKQTAISTMKSLIKNPQIAHQVHNKVISDSKKLKTLCDKYIKMNFSKMTDKELFGVYNKLSVLKQEVNGARDLGWLLETKFELLSKYIIKEIIKYIKNGNLNLDPNLVFAKLAQSTKITPPLQEKIDLIKTALKVKTIGGFKKISKSHRIYGDIKKHLQNYFYIFYGIEGPKQTLKDVIQDIESILQNRVNPQKQLKFLLNGIKQSKKDKKKLFNLLKPSNKFMEMVKIAEDISFTKPYSKSYQFYSHYLIDKIFSKLCQRHYLTITQMRYMLHDEVEDLVLRGRSNKNELKQRYEFCVYFSKNGQLVLYSEEKAKKFLRSYELVDENTKIDHQNHIKGQIANLGYARGKVKIINSPSEIRKMDNGDILVSEMTTPEIVSAMKKAGAIVTDEGGITCHAAIVSRELGIPCVIGTKIATKVLKDGNLVEVDANKGTVRKL